MFFSFGAIFIVASFFIKVIFGPNVDVTDEKEYQEYELDYVNLCEKDEEEISSKISSTESETEDY